MKVCARGTGAKEIAIMKMLKSRTGVGAENIIQFYEAFEVTPGFACLVFEVMWTNAKEFCDPFSNMQVKERLIKRIARELLKGLVFLKSKKILHNGKSSIIDSS